MMVMIATPSAPTSMTALPFALLPILCCKAMIFFHCVCLCHSLCFCNGHCVQLGKEILIVIMF